MIEKLCELFRENHYQRYQRYGTPREYFRCALLDNIITYGFYEKAKAFFGDKWEVQE